MNKIISTLFCSFFLLASCHQKTTDTVSVKPIDWWNDATIYEINTRQFSSSGSFEEVRKQLPRLKEMGVDILWFMPVQPIGSKNRKGSLGSYYSIQDYTAINPEFGSMDDFKQLVDDAHKQGMKVILDWVANHTSWDAKWINNEGWYSLDSLGNKYSPYDWSDVVELNYDNAKMRNEMIQSMKYWMDSVHIDGFRADMAHEVPTDFWNEASDSLRKYYPNIFMLAESENSDLMKKAFNMNYAWELHHLLNSLAKGEASADSVWSFYNKKNKEFSKQDIQMIFTSNHDENSWAGTEFERMGAAAPTFAALTYLLPGMPLIYNGQETGFNRRLAFFEKDSIDWNTSNQFGTMYKHLNVLRKDNPALWSGLDGGTFEEIVNSNPKNILSFKRIRGRNSVIAVFNLSDKPQTVLVSDEQLKGSFSEFGTSENVTLNKELRLNLAPYEYKIYTQK
ncbi:MAG: alpha-amylase family glycosyl hydrolase [Bacteroidales bacterium]